MSGVRGSEQVLPFLQVGGAFLHVGGAFLLGCGRLEMDRFGLAQRDVEIPAQPEFGV